MIRQYQRYVKKRITIDFLGPDAMYVLCSNRCRKTDIGKNTDKDTIQNPIFTQGEVKVTGRPEDTENVTTEKITSKEIVIS